MKRPSPSPDESQGHVQKKQKSPAPAHRHHRLPHRQTGADAAAENPQDGVLIDYQLNKAICVALYGIGFTSVTRQALSSFRDAVQEHMLHFSLRVSESMHACRRSNPTPQDFVHALAQFNLTPSSLKADLKLDVPGAVTQAPILPALPSDSSSAAVFNLDQFVPQENTSARDVSRKPYIPNHFPRYPSKHAYSATPVYSQRETDALRIRERATQEGMLAEQALRKLMAANKTVERHSKKLGRLKHGAAADNSEEVWKEAFAAVGEEDASRKRKDKDEIMFDLEGAADARDREELEEADTGIGGAVNYDRMFWRRGVGRNRLRIV